SSLFGSFVENGPLAISDSGLLVSNPNSWHHQANMLYVEQPYGTGFSAVTASNPGPYDEYQKLYLTGESYAGTYIPYIGGAISACESLLDGTKINLAGVIVGDGVLNNNIQFSEYTSYAELQYLENENFLGINDNGPALGMDDGTTLLQVTELIATNCSSTNTSLESDNIVLGPYGYDFSQCDVVDFIAFYYAALTNGSSCLDFYNINDPIPCSDNDQYYVQENLLAQYLNTPEVRAAVHVDPYLKNTVNMTWQLCTIISISQNVDEQYPNSDTFLPGLVEKGVKVFVYNGALDILIDYVSTEEVLANLTWGGETGFKNQPSNWIVNGSDAGLRWSERGLTYFRVANAGHMVPADQPLSGAAILRELLAATSTSTSSTQSTETSAVTATTTSPTQSTQSSIKLSATESYGVSVDTAGGYIVSSQQSRANLYSGAFNLMLDISVAVFGGFIIL
ncbi:Cell death protease, partial [Physocladia obscura]